MPTEANLVYPRHSLQAGAGHSQTFKLAFGTLGTAPRVKIEKLNTAFSYQ